MTSFQTSQDHCSLQLFFISDFYFVQREVSTNIPWFTGMLLTMLLGLNGAALAALGDKPADLDVVPLIPKSPVSPAPAPTPVGSVLEVPF